MLKKIKVILVLIIVYYTVPACQFENSNSGEMKTEQSSNNEFPWVCNIVLQIPYGTEGIKEHFVQRKSKLNQSFIVSANDVISERAAVNVRFHEPYIVLLPTLEDSAAGNDIIFCNKNNEIIKHISLPLTAANDFLFVCDAVLLPADEALLLIEERNNKESENYKVFLYEKDGKLKLLNSVKYQAWADLQIKAIDEKVNDKGVPSIAEITYSGKKYGLQHVIKNEEIKSSAFNKFGGLPNGCVINTGDKKIVMSMYDPSLKHLGLFSFSYDIKAGTTPYQSFYVQPPDIKNISEGIIYDNNNGAYQVMWEEWYSDDLWCSSVNETNADSKVNAASCKYNPHGAFHINLIKEMTENNGDFYFTVYGPGHFFLIKISDNSDKN